MILSRFGFVGDIEEEAAPPAVLLLGLNIVLPKFRLLTLGRMELENLPVAWESES